MNRIERVAVLAAAAAMILLSHPFVLAGGNPEDTGTANTPAGSAASAQDATLAGTAWRLVSFQSMDDAVGEVRPEDPSRFTMRLNRDGTAVFRLDCNRARGTWTAAPAGDGSSGRFTFGPLASTRARCPPPHLDELVVGQAGYVRGYLLREGRLYLSLMADGGIFAWEPLEGSVGLEAMPDATDGD